MGLSAICIRRPVFATVLSLIIVLLGLTAYQRLTVREYPNIDPPVVTVRTSYPGASAEIVESQVTQVLEDSLAGIRNSRELQQALERRVATLRRGFELATERYENGYSDYLEVLDTERSLFQAELQLASARGDYYRAMVGLYRALGGDWTSATGVGNPAVDGGRAGGSEK